VSVSLVIPTWNEAAGIAATLGAVPSLVDEIVVVDADSADGTAEIARAHGARVLTERRRGYGRALKTGFDAARGDILGSADGDGTYPLAALPALVERMIGSGAQFISCSRFPLVDPRAMEPRNRIGNRLLSVASSLLFGHSFADVLSGMWLMRREAWTRLALVSDGWNFSEEIKVRAMESLGDRFAELHIDYRGRLGQTKLQPWRVGLQNLAWLGLMRLGLERQAKTTLERVRA
jgi:hypothetical protein